jgi:hypothetical protein
MLDRRRDDDDDDGRRRAEVNKNVVRL